MTLSLTVVVQKLGRFTFTTFFQHKFIFILTDLVQLKNMQPNQLSACGSNFFREGQSSSRIRKLSGFLCPNLTQKSGKFPEMKNLVFCSNQLSLRNRHRKAGYLLCDNGVNVTNGLIVTEPTSWMQRLCNVRKSGISTTIQSWSLRQNKQIGKQEKLSGNAFAMI